MFTLASGLANSPLGLILIYADLFSVCSGGYRDHSNGQKRLAQLLSRTGSWRYCFLHKRDFMV